MVSPHKKNIMQSANLNMVFLFCDSILNLATSESKMLSISDNIDPNPIVIIIKKKKMHHIHGNGIFDNASGYT